MHLNKYNPDVYYAKHIVSHYLTHGWYILAAFPVREYLGHLPLECYKRPAVRRCVSNNGTRSTVSARLLAVRIPLCLSRVLGSGCRTLAAVISLEYLIGHSLSQSRLLYSWLPKTRRGDGAKPEWQAVRMKAVKMHSWIPQCTGE